MRDYERLTAQLVCATAPKHRRQADLDLETMEGSEPCRKHARETAHRDYVYRITYLVGYLHALEDLGLDHEEAQELALAREAGAAYHWGA